MEELREAYHDWIKLVKAAIEVMQANQQPSGDSVLLGNILYRCQNIVDQLNDPVLKEDLAVTWQTFTRCNSGIYK